ncbi:hypothetical protein [Actinosynnema sp. NPDC020468]|uniref:hypothetical protein n=1 Tax=Actinosynnema sp. NPDC020468 TaxID=3154488 RepID=UPI0033C92ADC
MLTRRDWEFLFDQLHSTHAVLDYLLRTVGDRCELDGEVQRYHEFALADQQAEPDPPAQGTWMPTRCRG